MEPRDDIAASLHGVLSQALLAKASALARRKQYAAAEAVLADTPGGVAASAPALDLLARIRAQQGRPADAARLWEQALEIDPGNEGYRAGLRRIERIEARPRWARKLWPLAAALLALLVALAVGLALWDQARDKEETLVSGVEQTVTTTPSGEQTTVTTAEAPAVTTTTTTAPPVSPSTTEPAPVGPADLVPQIAIDVPGTQVAAEPPALVVRFDEGLFASGAELKPAARSMLSSLARQLESHACLITVKVIGLTDDTPVPKGWIYPDNSALALARAVAVVEYLRGEEGLPAQLFTLQAGGEADAPYPNDAQESRLKNRTVIIRIYPREGAEGAAP
jgi:flagellar motor protein MotB